MRVYISGKISGLALEDAKRNFREASDFLRRLGFEPINPFDNGLPDDATWIKHLCRDLEMLHDCHCIYMLDNWRESTGACIEYDFAVRTKKRVLFASNIVRNQEVVERIQNAVHEVTGLQLHEYNTKSRNRDGFFARMLFVQHCRRNNMKLVDIARYIHRDHSSILHFLRKYNDEVRYNDFFRAMAEQVSEILER